MQDCNNSIANTLELQQSCIKPSYDGYHDLALSSHWLHATGALGHKQHRGNSPLNTSKPGQNGLYFADSILQCIFFKENVYIQIHMAQRLVPKGPIDK